MDRRRPMREFQSAFDSFLPKALIAVCDAYLVSHREANARFPAGIGDKPQHYESHHAKWSHPYDRKAAVDRHLFSAARTHGVFSRIELCNNGSCPHTLIIGGEFLLTAHFVNGPNEMVRPAEYRGDYYDDPQTKFALFQNEDDADDNLGAVLTPTLDDPAYSFLIHGESSDPRFPAFVDIVLPINNCTQYHPHRLRLCNMFPAVLADRVAGRTSSVEEIPDNSLALKASRKEI